MIERMTDEGIAAQLGAFVGDTQYKIIMTRRKTGEFSDIGNYGIALGASESGNYATWHFHVENGVLNFYWEHYRMDNYAKAVGDYTNRELGFRFLA